MKLITRFTLVPVWILLVVILAAGQSKPTEDVIFRAVEDEMARAMKDLKFRSFEKPYFLEYVVSDVDLLSIRATFGSLTDSVRTRRRMLDAQVRIGSYEFDSRASNPFPLPLDDDYNSIRRAVWFATDSSYKRAINMFEMIKAAKKNFAQSEEEKVPTFSRQKAVVSIAKRGKLVVDQKKWEEQVRKWSAMFRSFPRFRESNFSFYIRQTNRYLINSEGTRILKPSFLITVDSHASAVTKENEVVAPYLHIFSESFDELPSVAEIDKRIKGFSADLERFEQAKKIKENYIGPALFTEGASVQLFLQVLAPQLRGGGGARPPIPIPGGRSGGFSDRIGRRVLPTFLSVIDDPTMKMYGDSKLAGTFEIDDQGVAAKPLTLIENGMLKTLLMTRAPIKKIQQSNGRARGRGAEISNLIVKSRDGKSFEQLKKQLIEECKDQGLPFGIIFRENNATFSTFGTGTSLLFYKVFVEDGREELMRGANITDFSVRDLRRNLLAAGNDPFVFNLLINSSYNGTGTPASVVAPSVLFEEINLTKTNPVKEKPKLLTHPYFSK